MRPTTRRAGFTLIELLITLVLLGVVVAKLTIVIGEARDTHRKESATMALDDRALQVLDRISYAVMGSDRETLFPDPESPAFSSELEYRISLGVEDGEVVWGDPEIIGLTENESSVYWGQNPGTANERIVLWCNNVSQLLEKEVLNAADDNDNGLLDESGLNFVLDRNSITIRLTLEGEDKDGRLINRTVETTVTCRN